MFYCVYQILIKSVLYLSYLAPVDEMDNLVLHKQTCSSVACLRFLGRILANIRFAFGCRKRCIGLRIRVLLISTEIVA